MQKSLLYKRLVNSISEGLRTSLNEAKFILRNLPVGFYKIEHCYCGETYCENCNRPIKNIAIVKNDKNEEFEVGLDCAITLAGITDEDIKKYADLFKIAQKISYLYKKECEKGEIILYENLWRFMHVIYNRDTINSAYINRNNLSGIELFKDFNSHEPGYHTYFFTPSTEVTPQFYVKYLPKLLDKVYVFKGDPEKFLSYNDTAKLPNSGETLNEIKLKFGFCHNTTYLNFNKGFSYGLAYDSNGNELSRKVNYPPYDEGSPNFKSYCYKLAIEAYNDAYFIKNLVKLSDCKEDYEE